VLSPGIIVRITVTRDVRRANGTQVEKFTDLLALAIRSSNSSRVRQPGAVREAVLVT
jgi:hypothetical protein